MSGTPDEQRISLLRALTQNEMDWNEFNKQCASVSKRKSEKESQDREELDLEIESEVEGPCCRQETHREMKSIQSHEKETNDLNKKVNVLQSQNLDLERIIEETTADAIKLKTYERKFLEAEQKNRELHMENKSLLDKVNTLTSQISDLKSVDKTNQTLLEANKKLAQENEELREKHQPLHIMQKRKIDKSGVDGFQTSEKKVNCGLMRYRDKLYYGKFEAPNRFTFCKAPVAKINLIDCTTLITDKEKAKELNVKDCQDVQPEDVIIKYKTCVDSKGNLMVKFSKEDIERYVKEYMKW